MKLTSRRESVKLNAHPTRPYLQGEEASREGKKNFRKERLTSIKWNKGSLKPIILKRQDYLTK